MTASPERLDPETLRARNHEFAILDVRDVESFVQGHLARSGHVPLAELRERRSELPPRDMAVVVVAESAAIAREGADRLQELGYTRTAWLDAALSQVADGVRDRTSAARLWAPSPFLERALARLRPKASRRALDVAAGAGREAVFLAMHDWEVEAWDHDAEVLERARALAARHRVQITTVTRNLERRDPDLPRSSYDLLTVFRFLHRPLLPDLERALRPGGVLVYETYLRGQERFGRPRHPRFLLDPGELARSFPGLIPLLYEEARPPRGPFMARLLAWKPLA